MEISSVTKTSARSEGLAQALDDGTRKIHSVAENTQFVTGFFKGISKKESFAQLVASLYFVYEAMENAFEDSSDQNVKALDYPELRRLKTLEDDMSYYFGENWRTTVRPSKATKQYVEKIGEIAMTEPYLLVAHMYTRYLGDLFGGKVRSDEERVRAISNILYSRFARNRLARCLAAHHLTYLPLRSLQMMGGMARSSLKLDQDKGTKFYEFNDIQDTKAFIESWYEKLNKLDLDETQRQAIVDEGNRVFTYNIDLFNELEGGKRVVFKTVFGLLKAAVKSKLGIGYATPTK